MTFLKYFFRSLSYYKRYHLGVLTGSVLAAAIITASLIIGDSVKYSLQKISKKRIGNTEFVIASGNRFFKTELAEKIADILKIETAHVLQYNGIVSTQEGKKKLNHIQVYGVNNSFWKLGNISEKSITLNDDEVVINEKLAAELNLKINDEFVLRVQKSAFVSLNTPFVPDDENYISRRVKIIKIANQNEFGNFNLQTNQVAPYNVFISIRQLSGLILKGNYANLILIGNNENISSEKINNAISKIWKFDDIGFEIKKLTKSDFIELTSKRIFIDDTLKQTILNKIPLAETVFTYFVNSIRKDTDEISYSFVSAPCNNVTEQLLDNEVILNEWAAKNTNTRIGDTVSIAYFTIGTLRELKNDSAKFIVKGIIPLNTVWADSTLMPDIEGLSNVEKCNNWKIGIPVNFKKVCDKDEAYWKQFRGTPKAYVSYKTAKKLWSTKYGNCTAIRFKNTDGNNKIINDLSKQLSPSAFGVNVIAVHDEASFSTKNAIDFSGLFIGLSFFIIVAAIILISLLFSLQVDKREKEQGILLALGIGKTFVRRLFLYEGVFIAFTGSVFGALTGIFFSKILFLFLNTIWADIVRTSSIELNIEIASLAYGCIISFVISVATIIITFQKKMKFSINSLQRKNVKFNVNISKNILRLNFLVSSFLLVCALIIVGIIIVKNEYQNEGLFFLNGAMTLTGLLFLLNYLLMKWRNKTFQKISVQTLIFRNVLSKRKSVIALICILSIASFLVISTGLNRADFSISSNHRKSGTGGYQLFCESTMPVLYNLNLPEGKKKYGIQKLPLSVKYTQLRVLAGDDASCLNLNRAVRPRIISVDPYEFTTRNSFSFDDVLDKNNQKNTWLILNENYGVNIIPAIADNTVIKWGLGKKIGDTIQYLNERGERIYLKLVGGLAGSIFQGDIIISENNFFKNFSSQSGSNIFLAECELDEMDSVSNILNENFQSFGISVEKTSARLQMFNSVTNTYLDIFLALGGIALVIGIIGIAIVIIRNATDFKQEFAMMQALGISKKTLFKMIVMENIIIVSGGLFIGLFAAFVSVFTSFKNSNQTIFVIVLIFIFLSNAIVWIVIAARSSIKENFLYNLRNE